MAEAISLPPGAFTAIKAGKAYTPPGEAKSPPTEVSKSPKTVTKPGPPVTKQEAPDTKPELKDVPAPEPSRKVWKLKDGDQEFEYDASDEERVKRDLMKIRAADRRFEEAAQQRRQAEQFFSMLKDPAQLKRVLTDPRIGADVKKLAYDYIMEEMEEAKLTPEQKTQREKDRRLQELEAEKNQREKTEVEARRQQRAKELEGHYEQKIMSALKVKGVPQNHETVGRMADYLRRAIQQGYDISPDELAHLIKNDTRSYLKTYADALNEDELLDFLGEQAAEKLRKGDLKRLKSTQGNPFTRQAARQEPKQAAPKKKYAAEWRSELMRDFLANR